MSGVDKHIIDKLDERLDRLEDRVTAKLDSIVIQTTKTNGRVNNLERLYDDLHASSGSVERRVSALEENDKIAAAIKNENILFKKDLKMDSRWWFEQFKFFLPYIVVGIIGVYLIIKETNIVI